MAFHPNKPEGRTETRATKGFRDSIYQNPRLDKLEEEGVCIVLMKAMEKLKIIQQLLPGSEEKLDEPYQTMAIRMTTLQKIRPPEAKEDDNMAALKHVQKCRYISQQALEKAMLEVKGESEGMLLLLKHILFAENLRYYDNFLLKQENINLNNTINHLKDRIHEVIKNSEETRLYLDKMTQFCLEQAYVTAWAQCKTIRRNHEVTQNAKMDMINYRLKDREENVVNLKEQYSSEVAREEVINNEITNHLQMVTANLQKKFERWTTRYSEEVDALDIALLQLRSKMEEQQEKLATMSQQHAARQELVDVLQAEADERDREEELRLSRTKAAILIQQWWREILFLRHIHLSAKRKAAKKMSTKKSIKESPKKKKK